MKWLDPSSFDWGEGPPLSSFRSVTATSAAYTVAVILTTKLSRKCLPILIEKKCDDKKNSKTGLQWRPWFGTDLKNAQFLHNIVLVASSFIMLTGVSVEVVHRFGREGGFSWPPFLLCEVVNSSAASGSLYYWSYIYYLSKYYELLDTILQLARGKPPPHFVLHVYHHAAVLFMVSFAYGN